MDAYAPVVPDAMKGEFQADDPANALAPHSIEAEQSVLGSILINPQVMYDLLSWFQVQFFYLVKHQWIYEAMLSMANRGEEIDLLTLNEELRQRNQHTQIGGTAYLTALINSVNYFYNVGVYARIVKETWKRRRLLSLAERLCRTSVTFSPDGQESQEAKRLLDEATALMNDPYDPERDGLRQYLIHAKDLAGLPDISWLVPGEIPERGLTVVYGPSGVGKSFFVLDYAMQIAQQYYVLYVAAEGESGFKSRVAAWEKHNRKDCGNLHFYLNVAALLDEQERKAFTAQIVDFVKPKLLILDTVAHCMLPGDENSTRDMGFFLRAAKELQKTYDCSVLLVHHTNKGGDVERGSGALRGASDSMIKLTGDDDVIMVECSKSKDAKPFDTRYIKLLPVEVGQDQTGNPIYAPVVIAAEKVQRTRFDPLTNRQRTILETIHEVFASDGAALGDLLDTVNPKIPRGSLVRSLAELKRIGLISQAEKNAPYLLTADGLVALGLMNQVNHDSDSSMTQEPMSHGLPAAEEADRDDDSMTHEIPEDQPLSHVSHVSHASHVIHPQNGKAKFPSAAICPVCEVALIQQGDAWKCPDCGANWHYPKNGKVS